MHMSCVPWPIVLAVNLYPHNHDLGFISEPWNRCSIGTAGRYDEPTVIHTMMVLREQPLPWCEDTVIANPNLTAMAVAGKEEVNRVGP